MKMTYDLPNLPVDLEEEILSKVPATSLNRLRATCKRWNTLFNKPGSSEKHFRKSPKQPRVLMLKACRISPISVDLNVVPPSVEFEDALSLKDSHSNSEKVDIAQVFHCDGLLLCITKNENKPVIWNPCLEESRWIKHKNGYNRNCEFALGYANNQSCHSYKILMFWECRQRNKQVGEFEIYEVNSNSWRVVIAPICLRLGIRYSGVNLKGNTYWISIDESFTRLHLPTSCYHYMALSVVREEQLSVLSKGFDSPVVEMWVTKNIDPEAELSWRKSFAVDVCINTSFYVLTSLIIHEDKKVALCYYTVFFIGEDDEYYTETSCYRESTNKVGFVWPFMFNYVPSLVHISNK
ncbi:hypothetical protein EUTSA_v10022364mg, partial [Eutrema salsugineum]